MTDMMNSLQESRVESNYNSLIVQNQQVKTRNRETSQQIKRKKNKICEYVKTMEDEGGNTTKCLNNSEQNSSVLNQTFVNNFTFTFKLKEEEEEIHNYSTFVSPSQLESNKSPHKNQSNEQILIQRIKEKEQLLQQLQNYYKDLNRNYEETRNRFIYKISQQEQELEMKEKKIKEQEQMMIELENRNRVLQQSVDIDRNNALSYSNLVSSNIMSNKSTLSFNSNKSKNSCTNSVIVDSEQYGYKQLMVQFVSNFNINMDNVNQNDSYQYLSNQIYTMSKEIKHFRQFYKNMFEIIRDCQQKQFEVQTTKEGLKYIWKWIKGILDSLMKAKLQQSQSQTK